MSSLHKRVQVDTKEFDKTMLRYMEATSKSLPGALNTKAYWVARRAMKATKRAKKSHIDAFAKNWERSYLTVIQTYGLKHLGKGFKPGKWMTKLANFRKKGIGYLASGWLPTLRATYKYAKQKSTFRGVRQVNRAKGWCDIAEMPWSVSVEMGSTVGYKTKKWGKGTSQAEAAKRWARPALQLAINKERQSMEEYMLDKMDKAARKAGVKGKKKR